MRLVAVVGPTASGKSALSLAIAAAFDGEIISCDSTAVYRGLDIGTDKLDAGQRRGIPHHLVDVVEPTEVYSAARYGQDAAAAVANISASSDRRWRDGVLSPCARPRNISRAWPR